MTEISALPRRLPGATVPTDEQGKEPPARYLGRVTITPDGVIVTPINQDDDEALAQLLAGLRRWEPAHV